MQHYSFVTIWRFPVPVEKVWPVIKDIEQWPAWWKGVTKVKIITPGESSGFGKKASITWKSKLPYELTFDMEVTGISEHEKITGQTTGELQGTGIWIFKQQGIETELSFFWETDTTKLWMNIMAPILRPAFKWNHDLVMKWGRAGLAEKLGV